MKIHSFLTVLIYWWEPSARLNKLSTSSSAFNSFTFHLVHTSVQDTFGNLDATTKGKWSQTSTRRYIYPHTEEHSRVKRLGTGLVAWVMETVCCQTSWGASNGVWEIVRASQACEWLTKTPRDRRFSWKAQAMTKLSVGSHFFFFVDERQQTRGVFWSPVSDC